GAAASVRREVRWHADAANAGRDFLPRQRRVLSRRAAMPERLAAHLPRAADRGVLGRRLGEPPRKRGAHLCYSGRWMSIPGRGYTTGAHFRSRSRCVATVKKL